MLYKLTKNLTQSSTLLGMVFAQLDDVSFIGIAVNVAMALVVTIAVLAIVVKVMQYFGYGNAAAKKGRTTANAGPDLHVVKMLPITKRNFLAVVQINNDQIVIGVTDSTITLLHEVEPLPQDDDTDGSTSGEAGSEQRRGFSAALAHAKSVLAETKLGKGKKVVVPRALEEVNQPIVPSIPVEDISQDLVEETSGYRDDLQEAGARYRDSDVPSGARYRDDLQEAGARYRDSDVPSDSGELGRDALTDEYGYAEPSSRFDSEASSFADDNRRSFAGDSGRNFADVSQSRYENDFFVDAAERDDASSRQERNFRNEDITSDTNKFGTYRSSSARRGYARKDHGSDHSDDDSRYERASRSKTGYTALRASEPAQHEVYGLDVDGVLPPPEPLEDFFDIEKSRLSRRSRRGVAPSENLAFPDRDFSRVRGRRMLGRNRPAEPDFQDDQYH